MRLSRGLAFISQLIFKRSEKHGEEESEKKGGFCNEEKGKLFLMVDAKPPRGVKDKVKTMHEHDDGYFENRVGAGGALGRMRGGLS